MYIPEEIINIIYKKYFKTFVLKELTKIKSIWDPKKNQSLFLQNYCIEDIGSIQYKHTDFERIMKKDNICDECINGECSNCNTYGFPCTNFALHGVSNQYKIVYEFLWII